MVEPHSSNFRVITTNILGVRIFRKFMVPPEDKRLVGPRQANLVLIAYASSEGSGEPAHPRSLARTFAARSYKQRVKRNLQTESHVPGPSEWLGMRSWNLSWRNARRHKFAWRGSVMSVIIVCSVNTNGKENSTERNNLNNGSSRYIGAMIFAFFAFH